MVQTIFFGGLYYLIDNIIIDVGIDQFFSIRNIFEHLLFENSGLRLTCNKYICHYNTFNKENVKNKR